MPQFKDLPRVGRSQGAVIFWGLVSVFFAAAFCYYFSKNHENEKNADKLRDQVLSLQDQRDALTAEKNSLQDHIAQTETELKTREAVLQDKETTLADEETRIDAQVKQSQDTVAPDPAQAATMKKFSDVIHKISQDDDADVADRDGRSVLRVRNAVLFAPGDAVLKPDGKTVLKQIAQALDNQGDHFELRIETFTDTDAEKATDTSGDAKPKADADTKPHDATSWELTSARAASIARYFHDETSLPFQNVLVMGRGDSESISSAKDGHVRSRRTEITLTPLPVPLHATEAAHTAAAPVDPLAPPPDPPVASHP